MSTMLHTAEKNSFLETKWFCTFIWNLLTDFLFTFFSALNSRSSFFAIEKRMKNQNEIKWNFKSLCYHCCFVVVASLRLSMWWNVFLFLSFEIRLKFGKNFFIFCSCMFGIFWDRVLTPNGRGSAGNNAKHRVQSQRIYR